MKRHGWIVGGVLAGLVLVLLDAGQADAAPLPPVAVVLEVSR